MLEHVGSVQEAMVNEFTNNVSDITSLNGLISNESKTMDAYKIALDRKDSLFFEFVKLKALPSAYEHCIDEIIRRRAFGIIMNNEINQHLFDIFDTFRKNEIEKRKEFISEYGILPHDLVNGLRNMPGAICINYEYMNEEQLPIIDYDIDKVKSSLCKEFEEVICSRSECKWKWNGNVNVNGYQIQKQANKNNLNLFKEQNKWKSQKLKIEQKYEENLNILQMKIKKLEAKNQELEIAIDQYKRSEFPDPPNMNESDNALSMMNSEYICNQLSTILGASISNVNPSALQQSHLFLSKLQRVKSDDKDSLIATNQVLQSDLDKMQNEISSKDAIIKKLRMDNEKLQKQNGEFMKNLDNLKESSTNLRNEMEEMLAKHAEQLESIEVAQKESLEIERENDAKIIMQLNEDIVTYKSDIDKLGNGRTDLLQQIKMLSDVNQEWEEKFNALSQEYISYKTIKEQKDCDDWETMSYLTNENEKIRDWKSNSVWLNGDHQWIKSENIAGNKLLFVRDKSMDSYRAILDHQHQHNITVLLDEQSIKNELDKMQYPQLLSGEVVYIIQRTMPKNIGRYKKGDPVFMVTAGSLNAVHFSFD